MYRACLLAIAVALGAAPAPAVAAGTVPPRPAAVPTPHAPTTRQHTEFLVEVNAKGQVSRVRSGKSSHDLFFNAMTYGNALQAFIRTPDGRAISGLYRLTYDYNPKSRMVARHVALVRAGGVNPAALGAVDEMAALNRRRAQRNAANPTASATPSLPDFKSITGH